MDDVCLPVSQAEMGCIAVKLHGRPADQWGGDSTWRQRTTLPPHLKPWLPVPSSKDNNSSYICAQAPNYSNDDLTFLSQSAKA